jgi:hypothetical protein
MRVGVLSCCNLRLESIWRAPPAGMQAAHMSWTRTRFWEGAERDVRLCWRILDQRFTSRPEEPRDL